MHKHEVIKNARFHELPSIQSFHQSSYLSRIVASSSEGTFGPILSARGTSKCSFFRSSDQENGDRAPNL
ncbi:hypothetical protein COCNU_02G009850 [Cocos nucifera]|uniref:Uncharacterized protein n=1 Tax=Cocos nucifera TaxID=13894 RepID=A0A8K0I027_COCNU|nr:hypothetical protein COCNU_02G009850 [Cocos nucifera]